MPNNNNVIDLGKFKAYYDQLSNIQAVVDKLITKQNASVYNKIGTKTEVLFNSINAIDLRNAPIEDIRNIIDLLKGLRETCITLSTYKQYLLSVLPNTIDKLETSISDERQSILQSPQEEIKDKALELTNNEGNVA